LGLPSRHGVSSCQARADPSRVGGGGSLAGSPGRDERLPAAVPAHVRRPGDALDGAEGVDWCVAHHSALRLVEELIKAAGAYVGSTSRAPAAPRGGEVLVRDRLDGPLGRFGTKWSIFEA